MKNLNVWIMEMVCQYYGVSPVEAIEQPMWKDRKRDLTRANIAFALVCWFYGRLEMKDLRMNAQQIAVYFNITEQQATMATYRDQYLHNETYYRLVKEKVMSIVTTHLTNLYEREQI